MSDDTTATVDTTTTDTAGTTAQFVTDYRSAETHAGRAAVLRGKAVQRALMTEGVTLDDLASALTASGEGKVSKATLSNYGRAYREVGDAGLSLNITDAALPVQSVLRAINRGAAGALNDWGRQVRSTQTWTPDTFTAAMDALTKPESSRTGERKVKPADGSADQRTRTAESDVPDTTPAVDLDTLATTISAVDLSVLLTKIAEARTFSEGETATLFAGMEALTDALEHTPAPVAA